MKCQKCGEVLEEGIKKCPFCGFQREIEEFELPLLKKEEEIIEVDDTDYNLSDNTFEIELKDLPEDENFDKFDIMGNFIGEAESDKAEENEFKEHSDAEEEIEDDIYLEKTRSISTIEDEEDIKDATLEDEINKQIEDINEEALYREDSYQEEKIFDEESIDVESEETDELESSEDDLSTNNSINKRKKILIVTGIISLLVAAIIGIVIYFNSSKDKEVHGDDYIEKYSEALQTYYDTGEIDDVIYVLEEVKSDAEKVKKVQAKTRTTCDSWMLLYFDEDVEDVEAFETVSEKYKNLLTGLHTYALVKYDDRRIKALNDTDYDELSKQLNDIYSDSTAYFEALVFYNEKDYNKAYYAFERIDEQNLYYEKVISYKNRIVSNIIELLEQDIKKIENANSNLEDIEMLKVYTQIESIIFEYNNVYNEVKLSDNENYQNILNTYTNKVSEYNNKINNYENSNVVSDDNQENTENSGSAENNASDDYGTNLE